MSELTCYIILGLFALDWVGTGTRKGAEARAAWMLKQVESLLEEVKAKEYDDGDRFKEFIVLVEKVIDKYKYLIYYKTDWPFLLKHCTPPLTKEQLFEKDAARQLKRERAAGRAQQGQDGAPAEASKTTDQEPAPRYESFLSTLGVTPWDVLTCPWVLLVRSVEGLFRMGYTLCPWLGYQRALARFSDEFRAFNFILRKRLADEEEPKTGAPCEGVNAQGDGGDVGAASGGSASETAAPQ